MFISSQGGWEWFEIYIFNSESKLQLVCSLAKVQAHPAVKDQMEGEWECVVDSVEQGCDEVYAQRKDAEDSVWDGFEQKSNSL